jgi:two-component system sensor histidine kinase BaeS
VDDLQELALADAGELRLSVRPVDVGEVAARVAEAFAPRLAASGGTLHVDVPGDLPAVDADPDRLAQVLRNLVENAVTHGAATHGAHVTIRASREGSVLSLRVSDDGPGIPPEELERVFERFHRVDTSRTRGGAGGGGLGLAIVRSLVAAHGGTVRATSEPGPGATFVTTWPVTENAQAGPTFPPC